MLQGGRRKRTARSTWRGSKEATSFPSSACPALPPLVVVLSQPRHSRACQVPRGGDEMHCGAPRSGAEA